MKTPTLTMPDSMRTREVLILSVVLVILAFILPTAVLSLQGSSFHFDPATYYWPAQIISISLAMLICRLIDKRVRAPELRSTITRTDLTLWIGGAIALGLISAIISLQMELGAAPTEGGTLENYHENFNLRQMSTLSALTVVLAVSLLIPIFEEIVFRKFIFLALTTRFNALVGYVISSGMFALLHPSHASIAFVFSLCSCALIHRTGRLEPSIILHMTHNGMVLVCEQYFIQ